MVSKIDLLKIIQDKNILKALESLQTPINSAQLSKKIKLSESNMIKILKSLEQKNIIIKQGDLFVLSVIGTLLLEKSKGIEFLASDSDYFLTHSLEEIPQFLLQRIELFSNCEVVETIWPVSTRLVEFTKSSKKYVNCIFTEPPILLAEPFFEKIHSQVNLRLLFGKNSKVPDCNDLVEKLELNKPKSDQPFEKRICEKVITNLLVSDKGACLMLADKNNNPDLVNAIIGKDKKFIQWCNDFFEYKWNQGEKFARLRTQN